MQLLSVQLSDYKCTRKPCEFDRLKPGQYLVKHGSELKDEISNSTIVRYEKLFY